MPSRWLCLSIVAFWLATMGWLFWTEVLPYLKPGQPPPFAIDLLDEVNQKYSEALWDVYINDRPTHTATTRIRQHSLGSRLGWLERPLTDDAFELSVTFREKSSDNQGLPGGIRLEFMLDRLLITPRGQLLATSTEARLSLPNPFEARNSIPFEVRFSGEIQNGQFVSRLQLLFPREFREALKDFSDFQLDPIAMPSRAVLLKPMQPVPRMKGVRLGQEWDMPMVDPVAHALAAKFGTAPHNSILKARVRTEYETLEWRKKPRRCLVIDYEGKDMTAHTWVDETTSRVLRQEAKYEGYSVAMELVSDIDGQ